MLGDFVNGSLTLLLGYVYPAFECFKTIERNRIEIDSLRFWCRYWIIVALLTAFEGVGSIFVSWLPMYDEFKLAFFVYLWHQKTKGADYVYDTILRPYIASHEWDIDHNFLELRTKAGRLTVLYLHTVAEYGQSKFFELLQLFSSISPRLKSDRAPAAFHPSGPSSSAPSHTRGSTSASPPQPLAYVEDHIPSAPLQPPEYDEVDMAAQNYAAAVNRTTNRRFAAMGRKHEESSSMSSMPMRGKDGIDMDAMIHDAHMRLRRERR